jgi:uncharacterized OB-fold protein
MAAGEKKLRPVPTPTRTTEPFWEAAKQGKFLLQYDPVAKKYQFFPRPLSVYSGSRKLEWRETSGRGKLASHTYVRVALRGFEDIVPFILAAVDMDEGVRVVGRLFNVLREDVTPGMRLKICWEDFQDTRFYAFEPDA